MICRHSVCPRQRALSYLLFALSHILEMLISDRRENHAHHSGVQQKQDTIFLSQGCKNHKDLSPVQDRLFY